MALITINTLSAGSVPSGTDKIPVWQGGTSKSITAANLRDYIAPEKITANRVTTNMSVDFNHTNNASFPTGTWIDIPGLAVPSTLSAGLYRIHVKGIAYVFGLTGLYPYFAVRIFNTTAGSSIVSSENYVYNGAGNHFRTFNIIETQLFTVPTALKVQLFKGEDGGGFTASDAIIYAVSYGGSFIRTEKLT